jgi:uncharacterized LabA/DUF88 family protein
MKKRVVALIDGFNFYHPIKHEQKKAGHCLQWLDYPSLLRYYVKQSPKQAKHELSQVYFFTAFAKHRNRFDGGTTQRHQTYIHALENAGVKVVLGNFKKKQKQFFYKCENAIQNTACFIQQTKHEEKETDVRIACKLLELAVQNAFDVCYLLTADSDLVPAIETLGMLYPEKEIVLITPPSKAKITKLVSLSSHHVSVGVNDLKKFQFPETIQKDDGYKIYNPFKGN